MKTIFLLLLAALRLGQAESRAQAPFSTMDSVDINNINAAVLVHGDMWWNPATDIAHCYFPKDSASSINFASALWLSGYDGAGQLHIAAQTYRQSGNDYWPGPIDGSGPIAYTASQNWAKIWKVNKTDIQYFLSLATHTTSNTPAAILTWPAKGNANAAGNGGAALTITADMAPFVDVNGNGIYEPLSGDYPDIKGDQALWWIFNDNGPTHNQTNGRPLNIEVHAMAYAYKRGTLIDNVIYYEYTLVNRSSITYNNFRFAQWDDVDLGYYLDDFIGFDSVWRMGIGYNGTNYDGAFGGHVVNSFGTPPPMVALTLISLPGDAGTSYVPVGSFNYFNNDASSLGNPTVDTEFNNYIRSKNKVGAHLTNDFSGAGIPSTGYGGGPDCNYVFPGDPGITSQWSECACTNNPGDQRFVISSNDFTLSAGSSQKIVTALLVTNLGIGGCPNANFDSIKVVADTAWASYQVQSLGVSKTPQTSRSINVYPNPAGSELHISYAGNTAGEPSITIYNTVGQIMPITIAISNNNADADISKLAQGLYYVVYKNEAIQTTVKFVKE